MRRLMTWLTVYLLSPISLSAQYPVEGHRLDNPTFLDETVHLYDVFFMAEMHFRDENPDVKKRMIEYLAKHNSVELVVLERSYAFGYWTNHYLETGDTLFLKNFLDTYDFFYKRKGKVVDDEYEFFKWLRRFNITNDLSIKIIGIDLATFWDEETILWSFVQFMEIYPELKTPLAESLTKAENLRIRNRVSTTTLLNWFRKLEATEIEITQEPFSNFIDNLRQSIPWARDNDLDYRDGEIAKNFLKYVKKGDKVYGQYGLDHIALENGGRIKWKTFGSILSQDEYYKGKILSVGLVCIGCDKDTPESRGDFPGDHIFHDFLTQDDFDRLQPNFMQLPHNTLVDLRVSEEKIKDYCQLLLVQFE